MRLYELARDLGRTSDELLAKCRELGLVVKNRLSGLKDSDVAALRTTVGAAAPGAHEAKPKQAPKPAAKHEPAKPATPPPPAQAQQRPQPPPQQQVAPGRAIPPRPSVPPRVPPPTPKLSPEAAEAARFAGRRRRRGRGRAEDDVTALPTSPVLGRYIPPSTIPRFPRRAAMRRARMAPSRPRQVAPLPRLAELVEVRAPISVKDLSFALGVKANDIILRLMQAGVMATINNVLDAAQVQQIADELKRKVTIKEAVSLIDETTRQMDERASKPEHLAPRPPVVTFLGHVDHGKTSLLDRIRKTDVAAHEHGGITQHIGAYRVTIGGKTVTFLDTPGHEAFTAMRARGANVTDIAVLVVAADDGVMPQTEEALDHARAAGVTIVVALNKCDKPEANPLRVKQQLSNLGLQPEEWGGETVCVEVSATTGKGVDELIEMLALVAELRELKADPTLPARATVLESEVSGSRGPIARVLVQEGTLRPGQVVVAGATFGRVKMLLDERGRTLPEAGPSTPVVVAGLDGLPAPGERLMVLDDISKARAIAEERQLKVREEASVRRAHVDLENLFSSIEQGKVRELLLILKSDVRGTMEALAKVIQDIPTQEVKIRILRNSVGGISASDVLLADASDAVIVGMNVTPDPAARAMAESKGVAIRTYTVIYKVKEELQQALVGMLTPIEREKVMGHVEVRRIFKISRIGNVAGCYVTDGTIMRNNRVRLVRDGAVIHTGKLASLRREKDDVREVRAGFECGLHLDGYEDIKAGDVIESFEIEKIARTLGS